MRKRRQGRWRREGRLVRDGIFEAGRWLYDIMRLGGWVDGVV